MSWGTWPAARPRLKLLRDGVDRHVVAVDAGQILLLGRPEEEIREPEAATPAFPTELRIDEQEIEIPDPSAGLRQDEGRVAHHFSLRPFQGGFIMNVSPAVERFFEYHKANCKKK